MKAVALVFAGLVCAGCQSNGKADGPDASADLVPVRQSNHPGPIAFCNRVDGGLRVTVKNQGKLGVGATKVRVTYHYSDGDRQREATVPPLLAGGSASVVVLVPPPIPAGDFSFTIEVDADKAVAEKSESNNTAKGHCIT